MQTVVLCRPLFAQFCANDPATLLRAAQLVQERCDAVDLNLGCPQRIARKGRYGAFLMDDLPLIERLVSALSTSLAVPVTCKIRIFPELQRTLEYARMLQAAGCSILAVHGRTRDQKRARDTRADWDAIKVQRPNIQRCLSPSFACIAECGSVHGRTTDQKRARDTRADWDAIEVQLSDIQSCCSLGFVHC